MSDTIEGLRRKIDGAATLGSVVRTMKAMAAASIGQFEEAVRALADYERTVELGLSACLGQLLPIPPEAPRARVGPGTGAIVFGSDQGLVGRFNEALGEFVVTSLAGLPGPKSVLVVGERIGAHLVEAGLSVVGPYHVPTSVSAIAALIGAVQIESESRRARGEYAQVYVFHNRPHSGSLYEPVSQRALPLDDRWQERLAAIPWPTARPPEVLGGREDALRRLIREYLFVTFFKACAESLASENASRLAAMIRAEKNIDAMSTDLRQNFCRLRQSSIDDELFDVLSGYSAALGR